MRGIPNRVGLEQTYELQERVFFHEIHCRLHTLEVLLGHGYFHAERHGVRVVLHFFIEVCQQVAFLNGGQVKQHEKGKQQHDAGYRQPYFSLDRQAQMPDNF